MDITEQKKTFAGFIKGAIWLSAIVAVALIFLAIVGI
ncbi:MAG: aa3-type cytochrome c oxidase subunit IV [Pseudomonadota bacterium]